MSRDPTLPDDIESLKSLVIAQRAIIATAQATLLERDLLIGKMRLELARLKRMQFGRSSEQLDTRIAQLELTLEELEAAESEITAASAPAPARALAARDGDAHPAVPLPELWRGTASGR